MPPKQTDPNARPWLTVTENAEAQRALTRALDSGRWSAAEVIAVLEGGTKREAPGPPTPEEILAAGGRLARMVAVAMVPQSRPWSREVSEIADRTAGILRRRDSSRYPG